MKSDDEVHMDEYKKEQEHLEYRLTVVKRLITKLQAKLS